MIASPALCSSAGAMTITEEEFEATSRQIIKAANVNEDDADMSEDELTQLLQQLREEPANDEECAAKFALYEKYAETVSNARTATLEFWSEAASEFEGGAKEKVQDDIRKIDDHNNLGFDFAAHSGGRRWFVYDMAQTAHRNAGVIERLLQSIRTKIELLASQAECPVCLEAFTADDNETGEQTDVLETQTLGCCHKLCKPCWVHWQRVNRHHAFCPLCRQQDFLVRIMGQAEDQAEDKSVPVGAAGVAAAIPPMPPPMPVLRRQIT